MPTLAAHVCKKSPAAKATGESVQTGIRQEKAANLQPTNRPTEYRCYIKEVIPIWAAGAEISSWKNPSSTGQLPVPAALDARLPTLFAIIIHEVAEKVNRKIQILETNCKISGLESN